MRIVAYACALLLLCTSYAAAEDWPTYLHDNGRTGGTSERLEFPLAASWIDRTTAPPDLAWEGPREQPIEGVAMRHRVDYDDALHVAIAGDRVYYGSSVDHHIYCRNVATGQLLWRYPTEAAIRLSPTVWQGKVYVGSDDGCVYCLDAAEGTLIWQKRVAPEDDRLLARGHMISRWPVRTGVLVEDGIAYFGAGIFPHDTIYLVAADAETGDELWRNDYLSQADAEREDITPQGYLLAENDYLFVPSGRSLPAGFQRSTGELLHHQMHHRAGAAGGVVGGTRALLADGYLYASGDEHFFAMEQGGGEAGHAYILARRMAAAGDRAYTVTGERLSAIVRADHADATLLRVQLGRERQNVIREFYRGNIEEEEYNNRLQAYDEAIEEKLATGRLWVTECPAEGALIATAGAVFVGGEGFVTAYDSETGEEIWSHEVEGEVRGLAAGAGHLLVSTSAGLVYCFASAGDAPRRVSEVAERIGVDGDLFPADEYTDDYAQVAEEMVANFQDASGLNRGYCLVNGSEEGRLMWELAQRTELVIIGVESDPEKVARSRERLMQTGLYGHRLIVLQCEPNQRLPLSNYFANLIVSDTELYGNHPPFVDILRHLKPHGGVIVTKYFDPNYHENGPAIRDALPQSGQWSHQYGNAANTGSSDDYLIKGNLRVLWYGDPGPSQMVNRHSGAAAPLSTHGRMFVQGVDRILCYDAYNGLYLWEYENPTSLRTGVFNNEETSDMAASDDRLFVVEGDHVTAVDAATGEPAETYTVEQADDDIARSWGYVAHYEGLLLGTRTIDSELARELRRRGRVIDRVTDRLFAIDTETGERLWTYDGDNILHVTIAAGGGCVYFIDSSLTAEARQAMLRADKTEFENLSPEEQAAAEEEIKSLDVRMAVCLNARTGEQLWAEPVDVTDCSRVGIGGGQLTMMYADGYLLVCGANANGHFWNQFINGEFNQRRLVVLDAETGEVVWHEDANYRSRPVIANGEIIAEPWSFDLATGEQKMTVHPLTGIEQPWQFIRPGHHCGMVTASPNMLFFRSGYTGYYDLYNDSGTSHFAGHRLGCWINMIPAGGLVVAPEASAGCVCLFSITSTVVFEPTEEPNDWRLYTTPGERLPVASMRLNLAGPGDRRDGVGNLWLGTPRPWTIQGLDLPIDIRPEFAEGGTFVARNNESLQIDSGDGEEPAWIYASAAVGLTRCRLRLQENESEPASYTVRLHFCELDETAQPEQASFDIRLGGELVAEGVDIVKEAGGPRRGLVREFTGVDVTEILELELVAQEGSPRPPHLCAIEVLREE